jgi:hypothetical protein
VALLETSPRKCRAPITVWRCPRPSNYDRYSFGS